MVVSMNYWMIGGFVTEQEPAQNFGISEIIALRKCVSNLRSSIHTLQQGQSIADTN